MTHEELGECIGLGLVLLYPIGVPVTFGYLYTVTTGDPQQALGALIGALFWPLYLLGKVGAWLA